ncbi:MAG: hypothetical protein EAY75_14265 [Bacteroidetes bacterium]|nr:MAG: hypothetical protein EAY75_14265 [Bacteroidota bacterium]
MELLHTRFFFATITPRPAAYKLPILPKACHLAALSRIHLSHVVKLSCIIKTPSWRRWRGGVSTGQTMAATVPGEGLP